MTETTRSDIRAIIVAVTSAAVIGMGSAYLTATATLSRFEADQVHLQARVQSLEAAQKDTMRDLSAATAELRVLNERLKRVDDIGDAVKRVDRKVDTALVGTRER